MKFIFSSTLFLFSLTSLASPIVVYYETPEGQEYANHVKEYFEKKQHIPGMLIAMKMTQKNCEEVKSFEKLSVCTKNNGDLKVVSADKNFINETLIVFKQP
jgi:hypothetical protein